MTRRKRTKALRHQASQSRQPFDIDLTRPDGLVTARFQRTGAWPLPIGFLDWLGQAELIDTFDQWITNRVNAELHGDAITPFLERYDAPATVKARMAIFVATGA